MMTETNRREQLAEAEAHSAAAREAYTVAKTRAAKLEAAEELEFWSNKTAFLANVKAA